MIPIKDYNPTRHFPIITVVLIALNVLIFLQDMMTGHYEPMLVETARGTIKVNQYIGGLTANYALVPARLIAEPWNSWYRVFTAMFLHGNNIEDTLGRFRFIIFYFACGLVATAAQVLSSPQSSIPMIGASGAVAGVMGAYLVLYPHARILTLLPIFFFFTFIEVPAYIIIGYWALLQFISATWINSGEPARGGVAYFAHIGGFVAGISLLFLLGGRQRSKRKGFF